jgi:sigma-B regulation protein RsbU (phosphoserine phosphatase)
VRYVNAGHNPPIVLGHTKTLSLITGGMPLGMFADSRFETGEVRLESEDLIILYSDGITEAGQSENRDFGEERLKALVRSMYSLPLSEIQAKLIAAVRSWAGKEPEDDMTLVLVRAIQERSQ